MELCVANIENKPGASFLLLCVYHSSKLTAVQEALLTSGLSLEEL